VTSFGVRRSGGKPACLSVCPSVRPRAARADHVYVFFFLSLLSSWRREDGSLFTSRGREKEWGVDICLNRLLAVYRPFILSWSLCISFSIYLFFSMIDVSSLLPSRLYARYSLRSALGLGRSALPDSFLLAHSLARVHAWIYICIRPSSSSTLTLLLYIFFLSGGHCYCRCVYNELGGKERKGHERHECSSEFFSTTLPISLFLSGGITH
jgi:hypothetical protein